MTSLDSLRDGYRAAVFGASGGVGGAIVDLLLADPRCATVYAGARRAPLAAPKRVPFAFDLRDEASIRAASAFMRDDSIDLVVVATGVLHDGPLQPEKSLRALDPNALAHSYAINAVGPALIVKHVTPLLTRGAKSVVAVLSARVGSIGDNRLGGWHAYRASKAALNQLIRTCAIEVATKNKQAVCVTLHPGTVATALSQPFQKSVAPDKLFTPHESATRLLAVVDALTPAQTGQFFAWDGQSIPF